MFDFTVITVAASFTDEVYIDEHTDSIKINNNNEMTPISFLFFMFLISFLALEITFGVVCNNFICHIPVFLISKFILCSCAFPWITVVNKAALLFLTLPVKKASLTSLNA